MGMSVNIKGGLPVQIWDIQASRALGLVASGALVKRVTNSKDVEGKSFPGYKRKGVLYVSKDNRRLTPKGGEETRSGKSVKYKNNYFGYKKQSTGSARVNLTLSGELLRSVGVTRVTVYDIIIGVRGAAAVYGAHLQKAYKGRPARRWFGMSPGNRKVVMKAAESLMMDAVRRHMRPIV